MPATEVIPDACTPAAATASTVSPAASASTAQPSAMPSGTIAALSSPTPTPMPMPTKMLIQSCWLRASSPAARITREYDS